MRRQRRGVMGSTNLPVLTHHCEARARDYAATQDAKSARRGMAPTCDNDAMDQHHRPMKLKPTRHEKLKLPLISSSTSEVAIRAGQRKTKHLSPRGAPLTEREQAKLVLGESIDAHETALKSYKNEHWYTSPIGFGSKKSVLLAAFKSRDPGGAGFITSKQLIEALQAPNLGMDERQARSLLIDYNAQLLDESAKVPYREFVRHLQLPDERFNQPGQDPTIFYQESYINRVRTHAAQLIEKVAAIDMASTYRNNPREPTSTVLPALTNNRPSREAVSAQNNVEVDRLSFELDKVRKQRRAEAKSQILLAHINRIESFSQHQQKVIEQHETMRLAAKALHRHAHFEQAYEEENRRLRIAQQQPKGMLGSPTAKMHHNVSKDSMFYVDPV
ncbi:hypothetical protein PR003_g1949 [Phytophthora rubi]|uniref:EF-hand domain-containing protein n=1 Tax=Phytophthora rubi TaxID=129364 RepID=A0A6A3NSS8_9STRA|nr:hypothetical protein PR002_g2729 [Phytophthora rubi]KAE9050173.1 hypothetical protein PR001_g2627 [Phytophthora rubi]KAE9357145.1 hypothetical protein PR003_g1949 [Phytophthora rubi]